MEVVQTKALCKVYGQKRAVDKERRGKIDGIEDAVFPGSAYFGGNFYFRKAGQ